MLLAGSPPSSEPMDEARRAEMVGCFAVGPASEGDASRFVVADIAQPLPPGLDARAVADARRSSPAAWIGWLERGAREDWRARVGKLAIPSLIVAGAEDCDLGEANQRRLNVPHFRSPQVAVVPRAAHLLLYEQPDAVADLIAEAARVGERNRRQWPRAYRRSPATERTA